MIFMIYSSIDSRISLPPIPKSHTTADFPYIITMELFFKQELWKSSCYQVNMYVTLFNSVSLK